MKSPTIGVSFVLTTFLLLLCTFVLAGDIRPLQGGEVLIDVVLNSGSLTNINGMATTLANAISLADITRFEPASVSYPSSSSTLFQYIIKEGNPTTAMTLAGQLISLPDSIKTAQGISSISVVATTTAAPVSSDDTDVLKTVLIVAGGATGGALLALIIAAVFCKPRATEAEERRMREKADERKAKAEAEMQVQQLVRSAAFQRLQERVIDLEKEESVRKAIGEVEEQQKKNKGIAKTVARQLLDEPFIEPQDRQIDREAMENDKKQGRMSESERRKQRAIDIVENAPWWHNAAIQAEITSDLAMPRYVGLNLDDDDAEEDLDMYFGTSAYGGHTGELTKTVGNKNQRSPSSALVPKRKKAMAKIPNHLIDYSAVKIIAEGHHWLSHNELPKCNPTIESQIMLAKSNLHGIGVFARRFIDRGTLLFPWANPNQINSSKHIYSANEMRYHFGNNWDGRLHFVARDGYNKKFCVAEDPKSRGWGSCINSCRGTGGGLIANCECVFPDQPGAGVLPWVRVTQTIAPLGELLLDYPFPELIQQQRGLDPNEFDEPPTPSFSTYGASMNLPLMNASYGGSAPLPRQHIHDPLNPGARTTGVKEPSVPPTPPPVPQSATETPSKPRSRSPPDEHEKKKTTTGDGYALEVEPLQTDTTVMYSPKANGGDDKNLVSSPHASVPMKDKNGNDLDI